MKFKERVTLNENFKKSTNLVLDHGNVGFLKDYILSISNQSNLAQIIASAKGTQAAFTFTGPYGSGKSSFALFLSNLLVPSESLEGHRICVDKIEDSALKKDAFLSNKKSRTLISIVAAPVSPLELLGQALDCEAKSETILKTIETKMAHKDGLVIIIDEMGKLLEKTAQTHMSDIYILQQIAELANNSEGRLIFIGILHQSFAEYAVGLNKTAQDEWYKIHGRFTDLVIDTSNEEKLDLIGRTIVSKDKPTKADALIDASIKVICKNRRVDPKNYEILLKQCWPLNPIVALLLGPLSLKHFGQNQRSIFSFLNSSEPASFQNFLEETDYDAKTRYSIDRFWDYVKSNFDFILSRSQDARRWILAQEVLDKLYAQSTVKEIDVAMAATLLKLISLLEIFKGNTGLEANCELLYALFDAKPNAIEQTLNALCEMSLIREAHNKSGFVLFDGSDFDIDSELENALQQVVDVDYARLNAIASFQPIVAKRNYHRTGTIRWMSISVMPYKVWKDEGIGAIAPFNNSLFGTFLILVPSDVTEYEAAQAALKHREDYSHQKPVVLGVTDQYAEINGLARELLALEWLEKNTASLMGDRIARHEIDNRKSHVSHAINQLINQAKQDLLWFTDEEKGQLNAVQFNQLCSRLADRVFEKCPVLKTEMLNNNKPSANANGAVNSLLRRMISGRGEERLGIDENFYPPERGLFKILHEDTGIYVQNAQKEYLFVIPTREDSGLTTLWRDTDAFLQQQRDKCSLKALYQFWSSAPYGLKKGLHSVLFLTYLLSKEGNIAAYLQGMYLPEITELFVDYLIKESSEIEIKYIDMSNERTEYVAALHQTLGQSFKAFKYAKPNILDISRKLVSFIHNLNPWVMRTKTLSHKTARFRDILKVASDPNQLIFEDMVRLFNIPVDRLQPEDLQSVIDALMELDHAYTQMIETLGRVLFSALQINPLNVDLDALHKRAEIVNHGSGDFRIDALASRLHTLDPSDDKDIAGIASLAANKPIHDWIDLDVERAKIEIGALCDGFKKAELYAHLKGQKSNRKSFVLLSSMNGQDVQQNLDASLPAHEVEAIDRLKQELQAKVMEMGVNNPALLKIALIELGIELTDESLGS